MESKVEIYNEGFVPDVNAPDEHTEDKEQPKEYKEQPKEKTDQPKEKADPYDLVDDIKSDSIPWKELTTAGKIKRVIIGFGKIVALLILLYLFICSLGFLGDAFKLLGGKAAGQVFASNEILSNPIAGLMIGVLGM